MAEELKPCPHCGGHVQYVRSDPADGIYGIFCQECKAMTRWNIEMEPRENYGENERTMPVLRTGGQTESMEDRATGGSECRHRELACCMRQRRR